MKKRSKARNLLSSSLGHCFIKVPAQCRFVKPHLTCHLSPPFVLYLLSETPGVDSVLLPCGIPSRREVRATKQSWQHFQIAFTLDAFWLSGGETRGRAVLRVRWRLVININQEPFWILSRCHLIPSSPPDYWPKEGDEHVCLAPCQPPHLTKGQVSKSSSNNFWHQTTSQVGIIILNLQIKLRPKLLKTVV